MVLCSGKRAYLLCIPLFLAPLWVPYVQAFKGTNLFITADSMIMLGSCLLAARIFQRWLPDYALTALDEFLKRLRLKALPIFLLAMVFLISAAVFINKHVLHSFLSSADEHSCYFLAECLLRGKLWTVPHALSDFFNVVHVGNRDGKWFSVYPPGWPLLWAAGLRWGISDLLNPILSASSGLLLYLSFRKSLGNLTAFVGLLIVLFSPFFAFTSASYFSHSTCLFMISLFLFALFRLKEEPCDRKRMLWGSLAGFALGYGLMTRYLTMAAAAFPFLIMFYFPLLNFKSRWKKSDAILLAVAALFCFIILGQNYLVSGHLLVPPNKFDKEWERLGFKADYTPVNGALFLAARFFYLMDWFSPGFVVYFLFSLFQKRSLNVFQKALRYTFWAVPAAYFFYYSWGGNQWGPRYYYEAFPFLGLILADSLTHSWQTGDNARKKYLLGFVVMSLAANAYLFGKQGEFHSAAASQRKSLYALSELTLQKPSIVFIRGFLGDRLVMSQEDAVRNSPFLDGRILYAHDRGSENVKLMEAYPGHDFFLGTYDRKKLRPALEAIEP